MKKFKKIYIEITNVCNLACSFCPRTERPPRFMDIHTFNNILDQIKGHSEYIYFHVKGEPLLHPEIDKLLDLSHKKGFKVNITTNGTLIDKVKYKLLTKPGLRQINFSLHSIDGNGKSISKDEYMNHIISFIHEATQNTNILISLRLWNLRESMEGKSNRHILETIERAFDLPYKIEEIAALNRGIKISERVYLNQDYEFKWPELKADNESSRGFCYGLRSQAAILADGTVVPCCLDGEGIINLGNIHETSFSEIIESKRAKDIIECFSRGYAKEELCRKCGYRERFDV